MDADLQEPRFESGPLASGDDDVNPASLAYATMLPLKVTPPTTAGLASFLIKSQLIPPYRISAAESTTNTTAAAWSGMMRGRVNGCATGEKTRARSQQ